MATSNLRARVERLERQQGPSAIDPLIVVIRCFGELEHGAGISVDGEFYACPPGVDEHEHKRAVAREVNPNNSRTLIVLIWTEPSDLL